METVSFKEDASIILVSNFVLGGPTCVSGFLSATMDLEPFLEVNNNPKVIAPFLGDPNTSPLLRFTTGGSITRWSVCGDLNFGLLPQLVIWRQKPDGVYQEVQGSSTSLTEVPVSGTKMLFVQEISFQEGDVLSVNYTGEKMVALGRILLTPEGFFSSGDDMPTPEGLFSSGNMPEDMASAFVSSEIEISLLIGKNKFMFCLNNFNYFFRSGCG